MTKKSVGLVGIVLGIALIVAGIATTAPSRELESISRIGRGTPAYVGGDAYNFIIEASIRGGEIAGARTARAVYVSGGALVLTLGAVTLTSESDKKDETVVEATAIELPKTE